MKEDALTEVGFSKNEAKVYFALLRLGASTAGVVAAHANIHRTNVYDALERLIEKSVVTYIYKGNKKYFEAVNPSQILEAMRMFVDPSILGWFNEIIREEQSIISGQRYSPASKKARLVERPYRRPTTERPPSPFSSPSGQKARRDSPPRAMDHE